MEDLGNNGLVIKAEDGSVLKLWPGENGVFLQIVDRHDHIIYINTISKTDLKRMLQL